MGLPTFVFQPHRTAREDDIDPFVAVFGGDLLVHLERGEAQPAVLAGERHEHRQGGLHGRVRSVEDEPQRFARTDRAGEARDARGEPLDFLDGGQGALGVGHLVPRGIDEVGPADLVPDRDELGEMEFARSGEVDEHHLGADDVDVVGQLDDRASGEPLGPLVPPHVYPGGMRRVALDEQVIRFAGDADPLHRVLEHLRGGGPAPCELAGAWPVE